MSGEIQPRVGIECALIKTQVALKRVTSMSLAGAQALPTSPKTTGQKTPHQAMTGQFASFVGALPGPRTGMTYSTEQVVERLRSFCSLREYDLGRSFCDSRRLWRVKKMLVCLTATIAILSWRRRGKESIYMAVNSRAGLIFNMLHVGAARLRGFRCILHHHVVTYIEVPDRRMRWLLRIATRDTKHVMACQQMVDDFNHTYGTQISPLIVPPMVVGCVTGSLDRGECLSSGAVSSSRGFVIGHVSNLSICKGLREVIQTFEEVAATDDQIRLVLAGPCHGVPDRQLLDVAIAKHAGRIEYRGAVYDDAKIQFFRDIDGFLFPTKVDSWGIVLNESLAHGVPVISVRRACIPCLIGDAGLVIPTDEEFTTRAAEHIRHWISDSASYRKASEAAIRRGQHLELAAEAAMRRLALEIAGADEAHLELTANE